MPTEQSYRDVAGQGLVGKDTLGKLSLGQARVLSPDPEPPFPEARTFRTSQVRAELEVCPVSICVFALRVSSAHFVIRLTLTPRG